MDRRTIGLLMPSASLGDVDVVELSTGWTSPAWRGHGISTYLHECTAELIDDSKTLIVGVCQGTGSSRILDRQGYGHISWQSAAFVSALSGWRESGCWYFRKGGWQPEILLPPCTGADSGNLKDHPWDEYVHYWVSDAPIAGAIDSELRTMMGDDIVAWRKLIATTLRIKV
jgi:hypothetical protein